MISEESLLDLEPIESESIVPLISTLEPEPEDSETVVLNRGHLWSLYLSHFLSTWNARGYEFAAIIFTASAYPDTLTASSIRGIVTTLATLFLSSAVGRWADTHLSRLRALRTTIFFQRVCVVVACGGWAIIAREGYVSQGQAIPRALQDEGQNGAMQKAGIMAAVIVLGVGERLSAVGNMIVMERDWVPTLATATSTPSLPTLNAAMRRIDLVCKLVAPLFISAVALALQSMKLTAVVIAGTNAASVAVEWVAAQRVWKANARLRTPKPPLESGENATSSNDGSLREKLRRWGSGMAFFFSSDVCIPSLSLALLYFSVLSFSASMITYLIAVNFTLTTITIARTCSTLVEVSATAVMPFGVKLMESRHQQRQQRSEPDGPDRELSPAAVQRMGLWGLWIQLLCLLPVTHAFFSLSQASASSSLQAVQLFAFLALSRMGLWTYDLAVQTLVQTRVPPNRRGEFSGVEMAFVSACELAQWVATAVWNRPEEFKYLGAAGSGVVSLAVAAYTTWMWRQRGHLVHWEKVTGCKC